MLEVVEDHQRIGEHQRHVGQAERVWVGLAQRLDRAHEVIAEEADGSAREGRSVAHRGLAEASDARRRERVGIGSPSVVRATSAAPSEAGSR